MDLVIVSIASLLAAGLTLITGFGLNTVLLPVFLFIFPAPVAVAAVAAVHLANNLFKLGLIGRWASRRVVIRFGVPALLAAVVGAAVLTLLAASEPIARYDLLGRPMTITLLKLVFAAVIAGFALFELIPRFQRLALPERALPIGGVLSGFFGGLSGHQGALRSVFLVRTGLTAQGYVGTAAVISVMVDIARLLVYLVGMRVFARDLGPAVSDPRVLRLVIAGSLAAFVGSYFGSRIVGKVTMRGVRWLVGVLLLVSAAAIGAGLG